MTADAAYAYAPQASVPPRQDASAQDRLRPATRRTALALGRALLPAGRRFPEAGDQTIDRVEQLIREIGPATARGYTAALRVLEHAPRPTHGGRRFSELFPEEASSFIAGWASGGTARRNLLRVLTVPIKLAYFDDPARYAELGCTWRHEGREEPARWKQRIATGDTLTEDTEIECDVVVVGTGAGGAVMAKELAEAGHAVLMVEEGDYHGRDEFTGGAFDSIRSLYRAEGTVATVGNTVIPLLCGQTVGGSTTINSGTCFRTPDWVLNRWATEDGLADLAPERLTPYFERVESVLRVAEADPTYVGGVGRVVARGCNILGYSHRPLRRNAPDCDGAGTCEFGCPTGAKRSTNVSYVPLALERGAMLYSGVTAESVSLDGGRAVGIRGRSVTTGHRLTVRARATVLSAGALMTPVLLMRQGFGRPLPQLGRNLSIHPAAGVAGLFDEEIHAYNAIPQGVVVEDFHRDGYLLMGGTPPIDIAPFQFEFTGARLTEIMENYDKIATFGVMVIDRSHGRVRPGRGRRPLITYWLGRREREILQRGTAAICRIFLAAGAQEVYPSVRGHGVLRSAADLERLATARTAARDWLITAYHPVGTTRMALSPDRGVVSPGHEVFGVPDLFVADAGVLPSSPQVNPQVSIMTLATRAADLLSAKLDHADRRMVAVPA